MEVTPYHRFVALVKFDQLVLSHQKKVQAINDRLAAVMHDLNAIQHEQEQGATLVRELRKKRDAFELESKTLGQELVQKQKKLENTSDIKAYTALEHEIATLESRKTLLEEAIFAVWQELEDQEKIVAELGVKNISLIAACNERRATILQELPVAETEVRALEPHREEKLQNIPPDWLRVYEAMRQQYTNPVVSIKDNACGGCGFPIPSGDRSAVFRHVIVPCQQCRRLLVDRHLLDEQHAEGPAA